MNDDPNYQRNGDKLLIELNTQFKDFVDRYERDWKHTQEWRINHWNIMDEHSKMLNEIVPNYRRGLVALAIIVAGSITTAVSAFWRHIIWK